MYKGGAFGEEVVLNKKADRFKYFVVSAGSNDNPFGRALYQSVWKNAYLKSRFEALWATWYQRAIGIIRASNDGAGGQAAQFAVNTSAPAAASKGASVSGGQTMDR